MAWRRCGFAIVTGTEPDREASRPPEWVSCGCGRLDEMWVILGRRLDLAGGDSSPLLGSDGSSPD